MRLAIADPPYLGRADRWYMHKPDHHPEARAWDDPAAHVALIRELDDEYDGWAVAGHASTTGLMLATMPDAHLAIWGRPNAVPGGARVVNSWEPVLVRVPPARRNRTSGARVRDLLVASVRQQGFVGSKPPEWTRWVLELLGYDPAEDELVDVFAGSGAVLRAADGMLPRVLESQGSESW